MTEKICVVCGKSFSPNRGNQLSCSKECASIRKSQLTWESYKRNYECRKEQAHRHYKERHSAKKKDVAAIEFHLLRLQRQAEAKKLGLSYAQYIAQKGIKEI